MKTAATACAFVLLVSSATTGDESNLARLRELCARLEDQDLAEERTPYVEDLRAFVHREDVRPLLEALVCSPDAGDRALGRVALASNPDVSASAYAPLQDSDDPSVRLQAILSLDGVERIALSVAWTSLGELEWGHRTEGATYDLDGDGAAEMLIRHHLHGAYGQDQILQALWRGEAGLQASQVASFEGSVRLVLVDGRVHVLASSIYAVGNTGRAVAWVGVVAVEHRLYAVADGDFVEVDRFFTPFRGEYP